jgi:hypothetical protein
LRWFAVLDAILARDQDVAHELRLEQAMLDQAGDFAKPRRELPRVLDRT